MSSPPEVAGIQKPVSQMQRIPPDLLDEEEARSSSSSFNRVQRTPAPDGPEERLEGIPQEKSVELAVIRGATRILAEQGTLRRLADRSGQEVGFAHLPYLLSDCRRGTKVPYLLTRKRPDGELESAVLLHEYALHGLPTGIFIPPDFSGQHTVFASAETRSRAAWEAAAFLLRRRALIVLTSLRDGEFASMAEGGSLRAFTWAVQTRTMLHTLPLAATLDETLASLGAHTRRNLRHFRRRTAAELGATFVPSVEMTKTEFLAMNRRTLYPAPEHVAVSRLACAREVPGSFIIGLRAADGTWLSALGGRRYLGTTTVDWQMNADAYPAFSLGTAMRAFLLEDEVARGTRLLTFDGGTPHTMHRAFVAEAVSDLLLIRRWLPLGLLRKVLPARLPAGVLLSEMLLSETLPWHGAGR